MTWFPKQRIVVPIDFSDASAPAVRTALALVETPAAVHVVHVIPALNPVSPLGIWGDAEAEDHLKQKAKLHLETFLASHEFEGVSSSIQVGEAGNQIVEFADEQNADLIVIPSHGYHGMKRALLGSVAERVIRYASCETLVLRRPDAE